MYYIHIGMGNTDLLGNVLIVIIIALSIFE